MPRSLRYLIPVGVLLTLLLVLAFSSGAESEVDSRPVTSPAPRLGIVVSVDPASVPGLQAAQAEQYVSEEVGRYLVAEAERERQFWEYLESLPKPVVRSVVTVANTGAHSDAWWRAVSVCEQGGRNDAFFGYFSIMDGSAGGLDWSTQVAMANGIISRAGDGAWAASCVAAGYAAAPNG